MGSGLQSYLVHKPLSVSLRPHLIHELNHALQFARALVLLSVSVTHFRPGTQQKRMQRQQKRGVVKW